MKQVIDIHQPKNYKFRGNNFEIIKISQLAFADESNCTALKVVYLDSDKDIRESYNYLNGSRYFSMQDEFDVIPKCNNNSENNNKNKRKVISFSNQIHIELNLRVLIALCDDGKMYKKLTFKDKEYKWQPIEDVPQD